MSIKGIISITLVVAILACTAYAQQSTPTVASMPPVVVKTVPQSGDTEVDPGLTEIRVTFSKDMTDGSWSWSTMSQDTFPEIVGTPKYLDDKRTCVLTVKLEAGKTYGTWLNSNKFGNFKDSTNKSAVPYLLIFETRAK